MTKLAEDTRQKEPSRRTLYGLARESYTNTTPDSDTTQVVEEVDGQV